MSETIAGSVQLTHALDGPEDVEISKHYEEGDARRWQTDRTDRTGRDAARGVPKA